MVVSKDSKRKRKESPLIESSPEMPKRTKVQAQRKFAQGQSAPASSYSAALASSSTAAAGVSTSLGNSATQENREPPTEILPNKRPKTEDFLTFLCFRGTSALPAHLDFLNQNTSQAPKDESQDTIEKSNEDTESSPTTKTNLQKSTRSSSTKKKDKCATVDESSTSTLSVKKSETKKSIAKKNEEAKDEKVMAFAVRKRAEQLPEGNRRGRPPKEKFNKSNDGNRRSVRNKDNSKSFAELDDNESETNDIETGSVDGGQDLSKSEKATPQQKGKRGKPSNSAKKKLETSGTAREVQGPPIEKQGLEEPVQPAKPTQAKEKTVIKRPRQKEAPIFVPSPEPTGGGRMTRQRAFFEPVKVIRHEEKKEDEEEVEKKKELEEIKTKEPSPPPEPVIQKQQEDDTAPNRDIFEFSSEDEQPLAKAIKLKNSKESPAKKSSPKKQQKLVAQTKEVAQNKDETSTKTKPVEIVKDTVIEKSANKSEDVNDETTEVQDDEKILPEKIKKTPGRKPKKKIIEEQSVVSEKSSKNSNDQQSQQKHDNDDLKLLQTTTATSSSTTRQKKKSAAETPEQVEPEIRSTRPSRKTKEAATIYMGIIGQKLQLGEFDDDELSISSFPDLPNVKEMEKMETELKKNVDQNKQLKNQAAAAAAAASVAADTTDKSELKPTSPVKKDIEKPPAKRGRPPKSGVSKAAAKQKPTKPPQIEGMLRKREEPKPQEIKENEKEDDEDFLLNEEVNETKRKLEKSFSDSDDEPLAIKLTKGSDDYSKKSDNPPIVSMPSMTSIEERAKEPRPAPKMLNLLPITTPAPTLQCNVPTSSHVNSTSLKLDDKPKMPNPLPTPVPAFIPRQPTLKTPPAQTTIPPLQPTIKYQTPPTTYPPPIEAYPSPKINPNFLTPKFDRNIDRRIVCLDGSSSLSTMQRPSSSFPSPSPVKFDMSTPKTPSTSNANAKLPMVPSTTPSNAQPSSDPLKDEIGSILAANLMPSKEESGKIFGIASVSLAQSSGPDNTKCTLGKCGSIHKPVLGPVVPTESYLGEQLSSKERRKAKVNMTHEQIQKWLIECSSNPDEIQDDLDDDFDDNLRPNIYATTPPPTRDDKESTSFSSSSKTTRDLGKSESAWSGKGPSLKATPVVLPKDDQRPEECSFSSDAGNKDLKDVPKDYQNQKSTAMNKKNDTVTKSKEKIKMDKNKQEKETKKVQDKGSKEGTGPQKGAKQPNSATTTTAATSSPRQQKKADESKKTVAISSPTSKAGNAATSNAAKTPKRTTVYNSKLKETTTTSHKKKAPFSYTFGAFSADNEKSIYSFDKEEDDDTKLPISKPFRRQSRRESHTEDSNQLDQVALHTNSTNAEKKHENKSQSNVPVALATEKNKSAKGSPEKSKQIVDSGENEKSGDANVGDSDSDIHTFYIPLQGAAVGGNVEGKSDMIQGVAVKLGREGPEGPNQKVVMHATLVTKSQMGSNSKPLPDSMNVSEIVKNLLSSTSLQANNKDSSIVAPITPPSAFVPAASSSASVAAVPQQTVAANTTAATSVGSSKSVPVGTVQPRFKSNESGAAQPNNASGSGALTRVNSNSSLFSGSNKSRGQSSKKIKDDTPIKMCNNTAFPRHDDPTQMVEAPIFRPTEKEFLDPMEFIDRITPIAARFGICKIIPPASFKPECRVSDDMRFTAYNQYVHKMLHRWGPSTKELSAIKKYLATQSVVMNHPPWIGGMEVDLPRLYHTVQELGGLKEVIEKKKWTRVAEEMCIPKLAQDRVTKLDDIYCRYLLPYDTLSPNERQKLFDEVESDWAKREARARRNADRFVNTESVSNEDDDVSSEDDEESEEEVDGVSMECIVKGRSMPLSQFFRIARNTMSLWFKNSEPSVTEVEAEFWRHVAVRDSHVCVHSGSIDSSGWGYGFPSPGPKGKGSVCARHPWNLKVLTNNAGSVLRSLGPVMGVTVPTLHVGMLFSACCWYRDPHGLSWIEYLHTGASKLWYGIPDDQSANFRSALTSLIPTHIQNKTIWLPCDTVMVPPHMLTDRGVSLCRIEQKPGEYVVIFPRAYTSSVSTGYVVSESVYFATSSWLELGKDDFRDIHDSCEPAMFSLEQLLFALASDQRVTVDVLSQMLPMINEVFEKEVAAREQLKAAGVTSTEKIPAEKTNKSKKQPIASIQSECDLCRANLYISMVKTDEGNIYCLQHALKNLNKGNIQAKQCKLIFSYNIEDIENLIKTLKDRLVQKRTAANKKSK
ncbi:protein piccolo [Eupeodes corollae]|uniref:protein piccolo n=1 Tax=Eupeodes corollae TaxID=290404 RepID=UPI002490EF1D|nr:protein piccolo [Eupeodes corollae]